MAERCMIRRRWLIAMGVVASGALLYIYTQIPPLCGNAVLSDVRSPDGLFTAVGFIRNCGATTPYSAQVSILEGAAQLDNEAGNAFTCEGGSADSLPLGLSWLGPRELLITDHACRPVFGTAAQVGSVAVRVQRGAQGSE